MTPRLPREPPFYNLFPPASLPISSRTLFFPHRVKQRAPICFFCRGFVLMDEQKKKASKDLNHPPEARTFRIEDLLAEVKRGRVRIPPFQRGLRWDDSDRQKLLDSLYRGYPVGTLLFWETHAPANHITLGRFEIDAPERSDALWVVDGQQRIIALLETLLPHEEEDDFFFDLDKEDPQPIQQPQKKRIALDPSRWLPMAKILDSEHLLQWLFAYKPSVERRQEAIRLGKRIREYQIPAYIIRTESDDIPREVFERINTYGKAMLASEVFDAFHRARTPQSAPTGFPQIVEYLEPLLFGKIPPEILFRLLLAILGREMTRDDLLSVSTLPSQEVKDAYPLTAEAAKRTIIFLKEKAAIPHIEFLPYKQTFVFLGKFFHHHKTPHPRSVELLSRWLWRGMLSQKHRGTAISERKTLDSITPDDEEASVQRLLSLLGEKKEDFPALETPFYFKDTNAKLLALALFANEPRHLQQRKKLSIFDLLQQSPNEPRHLQHHKKLSIFDLLETSPQASGRFLLLFPTKSKDTSWSRSIVNRLFHPPIKKLKEHLVQTSEKVLRSHFLTPDLLDAFFQGKQTHFFQKRAQWIQEHNLTFFRRHARWEETDRPSLDYLLKEGEDW